MHKNNKADTVGSLSDLLDYKDLSKMLKRSVSTLRRDVANHILPFIKLGNARRGSVRFSRADIDKWIRSQTENKILGRNK